MSPKLPGVATSALNGALNGLTGAVDTTLDKLVVPGYSRIGPFVRRAWWPADPPRFDRPVDIVVTGASSGLGKATAARLAGLGARVHLVGRSLSRLGDAVAEIRVRESRADLVAHEADISDLDAIDGLVASIDESASAVHALVHSAGVMPPERTTTPQGHELALATHVLGPYLLTLRLRDALRADGDGRVIFVSSGGMYSAPLPAEDLEYERGEYKGVRAYSRTKRMQVVLAEQLAAAFDETADPAVHSMHPGWANTPGVTDSLPRFDRVARPILRTPDGGADTIVWLASAPEPGRSTGLFWHDRRARPTHYLPWQSDDPGARERLWAACAAATGVTVP